MNITIISDILPYPLNSGGAQAQFNMIDVLRQKHHFSYIFTEGANATMKAMRELQAMWQDVDFYPFSYFRQLRYPPFLYEKARRAAQLVLMPNSRRFQVERALRPYGVEFSHDFISFVNNTIHDTHSDIIQVEFSPCLHIVNFLPGDIRKIFVQHQIKFVRDERFLQGFELTDKEKKYAKAVKKMEIDDLNKYDDVITLTDTDRRVMQGNGVKVPVHVSPAAVNATLLPFSPWNGRLSFVGGAGHIPNQEGIEWFTREVVPLMKKQLPLDIVGSGWRKEYGQGNVHLCGFVDNLADAIAASIMIVPIITGSGMRMKILEAAAMSLPFVTTTVGVEGLDFKDGQSCLVADTAKDFANAIDRLADDPSLCRQLGMEANKIYREKYSREALAKVRDDIYEE